MVFWLYETILPLKCKLKHLEEKWRLVYDSNYCRKKQSGIMARINETSKRWCHGSWVIAFCFRVSVGIFMIVSFKKSEWQRGDVRLKVSCFKISDTWQSDWVLTLKTFWGLSSDPWRWLYLTYEASWELVLDYKWRTLKNVFVRKHVDFTWEEAFQ